ncbi:MAG: ABC transporter ATP-binding protein [Actinomycetota bacterium]
MALLEVRGISVSFGGVRALTDVSLDVDAACVTGLIGPNGAGKTTLFNVACGFQSPNSGRIVLDGRDITELKPFRRAREGVARTFQRLEVFGSLTARDNIRVAAEVRESWDRADSAAADEIADEILERVGLTTVASERVESLPTGLSRLVEVGRALATRPCVLLLDEPSSGLDPEETKDLATLLDGLAADGLAVLLVEHDVELVMRACTRIHVLDFGQILAIGTPREVRRNPAVQRAYLGNLVV